MPPQGNGELPAPKPKPGAEIFASMPTTLFFAIMFHAFFQAPPKGMSTAQIAKLELEKGSRVQGLHDTSGGKGSEVNFQSPQNVQHKVRQQFFFFAMHVIAGAKFGHLASLFLCGIHIIAPQFNITH